MADHLARPFVAVTLSGLATNMPLCSDSWESSPGTFSVMGGEYMNHKGQIKAGNQHPGTTQQTDCRRQQETSRPSKQPNQQSS